MQPVWWQGLAACCQCCGEVLFGEWWRVRHPSPLCCLLLAAPCPGGVVAFWTLCYLVARSHVPASWRSRSVALWLAFARGFCCRVELCSVRRLCSAAAGFLCLRLFRLLCLLLLLLLLIVPVLLLAAGARASAGAAAGLLLLLPLLWVLSRRPVLLLLLLVLLLLLLLLFRATASDASCWCSC